VLSAWMLYLGSEKQTKLWPGWRRLLRPCWLLSHLIVFALLVVTFNLGLWQFDRLDETRARNNLVASRINDGSVRLPALLGQKLSEIEFRQVELTGVFDLDRQVYVANRTQEGIPGVHVVTLFEMGENRVAVNRGFLPRSLYLTSEASDWAPPPGLVELTGVVRLSGTNVGGYGEEIQRIDASELSRRWDEDLPAFHVDAADSVGLLLPVSLPDLSEGPHFSYAIQWFTFFTIGLLGYPLVLIRLARRRFWNSVVAGSNEGDDPKFLLLHTLRIRGSINIQELVDGLGSDTAVVTGYLEDLEADALIQRQDQKIGGWILTPEGRAQGELMAAASLDASGERPFVNSIYRDFLQVNEDFLSLCADWGLGEITGQEVSNCRNESCRGGEFVDRLIELDGAVQLICEDLGRRLLRFGDYGLRFTVALERVVAGELDWFDRSMMDSYYTVWFELQENLLATLGIERVGE